MSACRKRISVELACKRRESTSHHHCKSQAAAGSAFWLWSMPHVAVALIASVNRAPGANEDAPSNRAFDSSSRTYLNSWLLWQRGHVADVGPSMTCTLSEPITISASIVSQGSPSSEIRQKVVSVVPQVRVVELNEK